MALNNDNDGFTVVKTKLKLNKNKKYQPLVIPNDLKTVDNKDIDDLLQKVNFIKLQLLTHDNDFYASKLLIHSNKIISTFFEQSSNCFKNKINVLCYGLGSFDESLTSRYQLALLLIIIESLKQFNNVELNIEEIYDPIFNNLDKAVLKKLLNYEPTNSNNRCIKQVEMNDNCFNFIFMPHCPKALYNNFLFANWSKKLLKNFVLFGNSFETIQTLTIDENFVKYYSYIKDSLNIVNEIKKDSSCELTNAFYDLSLLTFDPKENIDFINKLSENERDLSLFESPVYDFNEEIL